MTVDLARAAAFMTAHARLLDRRRFDLLFSAGDPEPVLSSLEAYRNPDGGYGWGLEPDLRSPTSQPASALHAFEVFADVGPTTSDRARELCDWLASVTLADGGLPFALPMPDAAGCAPFWAQADASVSSLQITGVVAAMAHRVAAHDPAVAEHPWLARANGFCLAAIDAMSESPHAIELAFAVQFLDAVHDTEPDAPALLDRLRRYVPTTGRVHVDGGADEEYMRPLDFAPRPDRPARTLLDPQAVSDDLQRLAAEQQPDGGWTVDFDSYSPAAALEWRGYRTVEAITRLRENGLL